MDSMMFSPYGYGPLPPSAMAEIEKKTAALQQSSSLRRLLELDKLNKLDKKHKPEPLQSAPASPPSSPPPDGAAPDRSIQVRRADSISQQQNDLMLKAARRSVVLPSLSIAIPPSPSEQKRGQRRDRQAETEIGKGSERGGANDTKADAEPLHKQVKFLAPDDGDMSDQSSICQSPSWEGYGQRKKEKKKEAERRKKEKEQAEKEAKAAKRRVATRLSKSPPPAVNGRASRAAVLSNFDRSLSDPMLISQHLHPENQSSGRLDDVGRAASADDLQMFREYQPAMAEVLSDSNSHSRRFTGGVKLDRERERMLQSHLASRSPHSPSFPDISSHDDVHRLKPHPPPLENLTSAGHSSSHPAQDKEDTRPQREAFPPSASRTPMLRHMPPPGPSRSNSFLQGASKILRGQSGRSSGETETERGRNKDGYVQRHREQSVERSVAEIAYEQLINNGSHQSSSTRSSSRDTRNTRRSSFTQEARSVAMKLTGKLTPSARDEPVGSARGSSQTDYFNNPADQSYINGVPRARGHFEAGPISVSSQENYRNYLAEEQLTMSEATLSRGAPTLRDGVERPPTSRSSASSSSRSVGDTFSSYHSKGRSLRDVAKTAPGPPKDPPTILDGPESQMLIVPYSTLRTHVDSPDSASGAMSPPPRSPKSSSTSSNGLHGRNHGAAQEGSTHKLQSNVAKAPEVDHVGSRVSEGSSSSSAYEDGSPPPSSVTTPDTSRPQSSKDVPFTVDEVPNKMDGSHYPHDDDRTHRQASEDSNGSSTSTTPRQLNSEASEHAALADEDCFGRTALPLDVDCDAQSFTTSFSNLDNIDNIDETLASAAAAAQLSRQKNMEDDNAVRQPKRLRSLSDTNYRSDNHDNAILPAFFTQFSIGTPSEPQISIPPRSRKRDAIGRSSTSQGEAMTDERAQDRGPEIVREQSGPEWGAIKTGKGSMGRTAGSERSAEWAMLSNPDIVSSGENEGEVPNKDTSFLISRSSTPEMEPAQLSPSYAPPGKDLIDPRGPEGTRYVENRVSGRASTSPPSPQSPKFHAPRDRELTGPYGPTKTQYAETRVSSRASTSPPSPQSPKFPRPTSPPVQRAQRAHAQPQMASAPTPVSSRPPSAASSSRSAPAAVSIPAASPASSVGRSAKAAPVSILKPARATSDPAAAHPPTGSQPPVLSALPKHMQLQAGISARSPATSPEPRIAPIAKMFVECCNCKFYHDMPSKLYECMAKPDAVVEDKLLGISGAITTMVKCPWCQHNMSKACCAGYAAVVYLKERLH